MREFGRTRTARPYPPILIVATNGGATELGYFQDLRREQRMSSLKLDPKFQPGAPLRLVQEAARLRDVYRQEVGRGPSIEVWAVFDEDDFKRDGRADWDRAYAIARQLDVNVAASFPCFELWYILHYENRAADLSTADASARVRTLMSGYTKAGGGHWRTLRASTHIALARAQALDDAGQQNPSTGVHRLMARILPHAGLDR